MAVDDKQLFKIVKDISGGINSRQYGSIIKDNQVTVLKNADIGVLGESKKRPGISEFSDMGDNEAGIGLFGFMPVGGTDVILAAHNQTLESIASTGTATPRKTDFTAGTKCKMIKVVEAGVDQVMVKFTSNNWYMMNQSYSFSDLGDTNTSPPLSDVATVFRQRAWVLKDNKLYWSDAAPADMSLAFDRTTDAYLLDIGTEKALIPLREEGIIALGSDAIYGISPGTEADSTPASTDRVEKLLDIGCIAGDTAVQVGDDVLFMATDGVRGLFRSQQDKLQTGNSYPLSFNLKDEFDDINFAYISKATAVFFDNKYFLALPTGTSTVNNTVWVYYPAYASWVVIEGWNVAAWTKIKFDGGEERLYFIDNTDDVVYRAWTGYDDDGTAITYTEEGRKEDFGKPLVTKSGGELKIKALSAGSYTLDIYAEVNDGGYTYLGELDITSSSPSLPIILPFTLSSGAITTGVFHLDSLGAFTTIRVKIVHPDINTDDIIIYERSIITYADEYQSE